MNDTFRRNPAIRTLTLVFALFAAAPALAKPWNSIEPGTSTKDEVLKKFGSPTKAVTANNKEILAYLEKEAIKGTSQVQFRIAPDSGMVERIDVFPGPVIDKETVETSFGSVCAPTNRGGECYTKKLTDDFRTYYVYQKLGLVVFFNEDGKTVQSFVYQPLKAEGASEKSPKGTK